MHKSKEIKLNILCQTKKKILYSRNKTTLCFLVKFICLKKFCITVYLKVKSLSLFKVCWLNFKLKKLKLV